MKTPISPLAFDVLKAESFVRGENTLAVIREMPFDEVAAHLEKGLYAAALSIVHVHDFGDALRRSGFPIAHRSRVYEVFNAGVAAKLLSLDPGLAHTLPIRIAMQDHGGVVTVFTPLPTVLMAEYSHEASVSRLARAIEAALQRVLWGLP